VLVSDDVVFTKGAYDAFVAGPSTGKSVKAVATEGDAENEGDVEDEGDVANEGDVEADATVGAQEADQ